MRRFSHWTPRYVWDRSLLALRTRRRPEDPWLTAGAVAFLDQWLRPGDHAVEWGAGRSTGWLARRVAKLDSFEAGVEFGAFVGRSLRERGIANVDLRVLEFDDSRTEEEIRQTEFHRQSAALANNAYDFALVDTSPRGLNALLGIEKVRPGGLLAIDNIDWYLPAPPHVRPTPGMTRIPAGTPTSRYPNNASWRKVADVLGSWRQYWTSDGVSMTAFFFKP